MKFDHLDNPIAGSDLSTININGSRHYLTPDGRKLPSVTTVLGHEKDAFFREWRKDPKNAAKAKRARDRGHKIHTAAERYLANRDDFGEKVATGPYKYTWKLLKGAIDKHISDIIAIETALWSTQLGLAGRVDCIAHFDGRPAVVDFKGSGQPKKEEWVEDYFLQATAYALMLYDRTGIEVDQFAILIANDQGSTQVFNRPITAYIEPLFKRIRRYHDST